MRRSTTLRLLLAALVAGIFGLAATSCSTFDVDRVAKVGDATLTRSDFDTMVRSDLATALGVGNFGDAIEGDSARGLIVVWLTTQLAKQVVGHPLDTTAAEASAAAQFGEVWTDAPQSLKTLFAENQALGMLVQTGELDREAVRAHFTEVSAYVDSRFGEWDPIQATLRPLGSA